MGKSRKGFESHSFYCLKCGYAGIPIPRKQGFQHGKFHRKKLYCIHCREEVNHMECRTQAEIDEFKDAFERGEFVEEAQESLSHCRGGF